MHLKFALIADVATVDALGKFSAIGIFDTIASLNFPMKHRDMNLLMSVEGTQSEKGEHTISIEFRDDDDNRILETKKLIELGNKNNTHGNLTAQLLLKLQDLPFTKPGQYQFVIFADQRFLGRLILTVQRIEKKPQGI